MPYIEFSAPPASGKTTQARRMIEADPNLHPGRRSLGSFKGRAQVNRIGLPPDGVQMWLRLLVGLPQDMGMMLRFLRQSQGPLRKRLRRARSLLQLLIKSRALAASPRTWVVDQGLQQWVLSCLVQGLLDEVQARSWKKKLLCDALACCQLHMPHASLEELSQRLARSKKHIKQAEKWGKDDYLSNQILSFEKLNATL